jgi:hypothetical protein
VPPKIEYGQKFSETFWKRSHFNSILSAVSHDELADVQVWPRWHAETPHRHG